MAEITLKVKKITVLLTCSTDQVHFDVEGPLPFPQVPEQQLTFKVETARGHGLEWLKKSNLHTSEIPLEVIKTT